MSTTLPEGCGTYTLTVNEVKPDGETVTHGKTPSGHVYYLEPPAEGADAQWAIRRCTADPATTITTELVGTYPTEAAANEAMKRMNLCASLGVEPAEILVRRLLPHITVLQSWHRTCLERLDFVERAVRDAGALFSD